MQGAQEMGPAAQSPIRHPDPASAGNIATQDVALLWPGNCLPDAAPYSESARCIARQAAAADLVRWQALAPGHTWQGSESADRSWRDRRTGILFLFDDRRTAILFFFGDN